MKNVEYVINSMNMFKGNKIIKANICRIQEKDSVICEYFCIEFIDFMIKNKRLAVATNLFLPDSVLKNEEIFFECFP